MCVRERDVLRRYLRTVALTVEGHNMSLVLDVEEIHRLFESRLNRFVWLNCERFSHAIIRNFDSERMGLWLYLDILCHNKILTD